MTKVAATRLCQGCYQNNTSKIQTFVSNENTNVYLYQACSAILGKYNIDVGKYTNNVQSTVINSETFDWKHDDKEVCDVIADYRAVYVDKNKNKQNDNERGVAFTIQH